MLTILAIALAAAQAPAPQTPAGAPIKAAEVCLTNACSQPFNLQRNPAAVSRAVQAGDYGRILAAGGNAEDVLAGARVRCATKPNAASLSVCGEVEPGSARLEIWRGLVTLAVTPKGADATRPGSITKAAIVLTDDADGEEIVQEVLPPPPGR